MLQSNSFLLYDQWATKMSGQPTFVIGRSVIVHQQPSYDGRQLSADQLLTCRQYWRPVEAHLMTVADGWQTSSRLVGDCLVGGIYRPLSAEYFSVSPGVEEDTSTEDASPEVPDGTHSYSSRRAICIPRWLCCRFLMMICDECARCCSNNNRMQLPWFFILHQRRRRRRRQRQYWIHPWIARCLELGQYQTQDRDGTGFTLG